MTIQLKAKHFINSSFIDPEDCPLARASKEVFGTNSISVGVRYIKNRTHRQVIAILTGNGYTADLYEQDKLIASTYSDPEAVIRELEYQEGLIESI